MYNFEEIALSQLNKVTEVKLFLHRFNLTYEDDIDYTLAVYDEGNLIATASKAKNVLKCFAILPEYQGENLTSVLIKQIEDRMFDEGLYHFFIFTFTHNKAIFESVGYNTIISSHDITILENGRYRINRYLKQLKDNNNIDNRPKAAIIMNGNPFTLGHRYLVETAAKENENVLVFVVSEDKSSFPFAVRFALIKEGLEDLENVTVVETGPYLISNATFPTYFLKEKSEALKLQTALDCEIFCTYYKDTFHIEKRYVGEEPYCEVTDLYNTMMKEILPRYGIEVKEIERLKEENGYVSASKVRQYLIAGDFEAVKRFVPPTTYNYLTSKKAERVIANLRPGKRH